MRETLISHRQNINSPGWDHVSPFFRFSCATYLFFQENPPKYLKFRLKFTLGLKMQ